VRSLTARASVGNLTFITLGGPNGAMATPTKVTPVPKSELKFGTKDRRFVPSFSSGFFCPA
jgi:hypothetical protein